MLCNKQLRLANIIKHCKPESFSYRLLSLLFPKATPINIIGLKTLNYTYARSSNSAQDTFRKVNVAL